MVNLDDQSLHKTSGLHQGGIFSRWTRCLVRPILDQGHVRDGRCSRHHLLNNKNLVHLPLLLDFKRQFLTFVLFFCYYGL